MSISQIIRSGLSEAKSSGAKEVELHHLPEGGADELANETLAYLRGRPGRPSSVSGWTAVSSSKAGVLRWWGEAAGMTTEAQRRALRTLRRQTYDLLDQRGLIIKPIGPSAPVDVSPAPAAGAADETAPQADTSAADTSAADTSAADTSEADTSQAVGAPGVPKAAAAKAKPAKKAKAAKAAPVKNAKDAKPAKAAPVEKAKVAEVAPAEGAPAASAPAASAPVEAEADTSSSSATVDDLGAWILRLDPTVWDLARFIADGNREVSTWAVEDNERSATMTHGQRVFLWSGGDGTLVMPGVWGVGWVVGPCQSTSVADGYWRDPSGNTQRSLFADVSIQLLPQPVPTQRVVEDPRLAGIEVLRDPFGSNPSQLTPEESVALLALVGLDPALPGR